MILRICIFAIVTLAGIAPMIQHGLHAAEMTVLRVCADPNNLPYSNDESQGFENKIAELIAQELGVHLEYYWWPHQRGVVRNTLNRKQCDVLIGIPAGYDLVLWTKPYYRTGYVIAFPEGRGPRITSLDDPRLAEARIGVYRDTPPHDALARRGLVGANLVQYLLLYDWEHPDYPLAAPIWDLLNGKIDVALIWGPIVGYFVKRQGVSLEMIPIENDNLGQPMSYAISMGVRKGDHELKGVLEAVVERRMADIRRILEDYGVLVREDSRSQPEVQHVNGAMEGAAHHEHQ
jgi:mxaJ protein